MRSSILYHLIQFDDLNLSFFVYVSVVFISRILVMSFFLILDVDHGLVICHKSIIGLRGLN